MTKQVGWLVALCVVAINTAAAQEPPPCTPFFELADDPSDVVARRFFDTYSDPRAPAIDVTSIRLRLVDEGLHLHFWVTDIDAVNESSELSLPDELRGHRFDYVSEFLLGNVTYRVGISYEGRGFFGDMAWDSVVFEVGQTRYQVMEVMVDDKGPAVVVPFDAFGLTKAAGIEMTSAQAILSETGYQTGGVDYIDFPVPVVVCPTPPESAPPSPTTENRESPGIGLGAVVAVALALLAWRRRL